MKIVMRRWCADVRVGICLGACRNSWFSTLSANCWHCNESSASTCCWHGNIYQPTICQCARWCHWSKASTDITVQSTGLDMFFLKTNSVQTQIYIKMSDILSFLFTWKLPMGGITHSPLFRSSYKTGLSGAFRWQLAGYYSLHHFVHL